MIKQLYKGFLVTFLIIMIVPSTSTAGRIKKHALKQVIGKVISINKTTNTLTLSCRKVKHSITAHNLDNVSVGEWVIAKVDEKGEAAISVRADQIAHCGKEDLVQTSEIRKVFIKDDMLFITNKKGRKKRIEIDHWMVAHSPNKQIIVLQLVFITGRKHLF